MKGNAEKQNEFGMLLIWKNINYMGTERTCPLPAKKVWRGTMPRHTV